MDRPPAKDESALPAAKKARIEAEPLDWAASFGKKDAASTGSAAAGGWSLRNWSQEKEAEQATQPKATEEEDWSFFQQTDTATVATSSTSSSSSASTSFKVPQGRSQGPPAKQRRVSFAEEVKVVTIPKVAKGSAGTEHEEFDAEGNPLYAEASIGDLEGGDLELAEEGEEQGGAGDDAPLRLSRNEEGVEGLIDYLLAAVPAQGKSAKTNAKYFGGAGSKAPTSSQSAQEQRPARTAAPKKFDSTREDLDEDSFLEAFIDSDDVAPSTATTSSAALPSLPDEGVAKEKKAKKKPIFKF
jgi:hypothetical protein